MAVSPTQELGGPVLEIDIPAPGPARVIPVGVTTAGLLLMGPRAILYGWTFRETTGTAAAEVRIRNGQSASGVLAASIGLAEGASVSQGAADPGMLMDGGVYLEVVSGSVEGSVFARKIWPRS